MGIIKSLIIKMNIQLIFKTIKKYKIKINSYFILIIQIMKEFFNRIKNRRLIFNY